MSARAVSPQFRTCVESCSHQLYQRPSSGYYEAKEESEVPMSPSDIEELHQSLQWIPSTRPPSWVDQAHLPLVVAIPQVAPNTFRSGPMPFLRGYNQYLSRYDVTAVQFVAFIDGLAIAQAPSPPIQAVQAVGQVIGFVPHHWAQLASGAVGLAAGVGSAAVSATRSKVYMKEANARFFEPRGLRASLITDQQLDERFHSVVNAGQRLAPIDRQAGCVTLSERRLVALQSCVAKLTFDVPAPSVPERFLDRLSAKSVKSKIEKMREKAEKEDSKAKKNRSREERSREKMLEKKERKAEKKMEKEEKEKMKLEEKARRSRRKHKSKSHSRSASVSSSSSSSSSDVSKMESNDLKKLKKLKWIVVEEL